MEYGFYGKFFDCLSGGQAARPLIATFVQYPCHFRPGRTRLSFLRAVRIVRLVYPFRQIREYLGIFQEEP